MSSVKRRHFANSGNFADGRRFLFVCVEDDGGAGVGLVVSWERSHKVFPRVAWKFWINPRKTQGGGGHVEVEDIT